jgi:RHS repeat-associated protein
VADPGNHGVLWKGYTYDTLGNVTVRADGVEGTNEVFTYDTLNRLLSVSGSGPGIVAKSATYDAKGNITSKSDIGTYTYGGPRPHAVTQAGAFTLSYDANGNLGQYTAPGGNTFSANYTSYNMLATLYWNTSARLYFTYNGDHQRIRERREAGGATTNVYFMHPDNQGGLLYEKEVVNVSGQASQIKHKHYVTGGSGVSAVVITGAENRTEYWHKDALDSVVAISNDTTGAVTVTSRRKYDPWGQETTPAGGDGYRGFSEHEQFDGFGIVHMNGRVYIPWLGRFTSADPGVQFPTDLQTFNRYAYARNNPLRFVDSDGFEIECDEYGCYGSYEPSFPIVVIGGGAGIIPEPSPAPSVGSGSSTVDLQPATPQSLNGFTSIPWDSGAPVTGTGFQLVGAANNNPFADWMGGIQSGIGSAIRTVVDTLSIPGAQAFNEQVQNGIADWAARDNSWWRTGLAIGAIAGIDAFGIQSFTDVPGLGNALGKGLRAVKGAEVTSGMGGKVLPMSVVRNLPPGAAGGVVNEAKALTFATGNEHAVVRLANGQRALVSGGSGGILFAEGQVTRIIGHTHPYGMGAVGPSAADAAALRALGQTHSYVIEGGRIIRFGQ